MFKNIKYEYNKIKENVIRKFVWKLPRYLIMWCYIRVVAHATTGNFGNTIVPEISAMDVLKRWDINNGLTST